MAAPDARSPWLTVKEAAARARCGSKLVYRAVQRGDLRAARIGARRDLRILDSWVDEWLTRSAEPREVVRRVG